MNDQQPQWMRKPLAPPPHIAYAHGLGRGMLTFAQIEELVKAINPAYVERKQNLTYLAQHQARAEMNRIFGYGNWDVRADDPVLLYEVQTTGRDNKERWLVAYRIRVTVEIRDLWGMPIASYTGVHAEENAPQPNRGEAHALALTSVDSYALRRALINLGDRFGLGLYNGGSLAPHGQYTHQLDPGDLFQWVDQNTQATVDVAPTVTHETIQAEPAVPEYDGREAPAEQPATGTLGNPPQMDPMQVAEQHQAQRTAERQPMSPDMQARLQQGLKTDGGQQ